LRSGAHLRMCTVHNAVPELARLSRLRKSQIKGLSNPEVTIGSYPFFDPQHGPNANVVLRARDAQKARAGQTRGPGHAEASAASTIKERLSLTLSRRNRGSSPLQRPGRVLVSTTQFAFGGSWIDGLLEQVYGLRPTSMEVVMAVSRAVEMSAVQVASRRIALIAASAVFFATVQAQAQQAQTAPEGRVIVTGEGDV